jgi:hypothetical protein
MILPDWIACRLRLRKPNRSICEATSGRHSENIIRSVIRTGLDGWEACAKVFVASHFRDSSPINPQHCVLHFSRRPKQQHSIQIQSSGLITRYFKWAVCALGARTGAHRSGADQTDANGMRLSADLYDQIIAALKSDGRADREKRTEPRVGLAGDSTLVTVDETGKRVSDLIRVRDVSRSGIGLIANQKLSAKQRFVLQLQYHNDEPLWMVCFTAYCRAIEGGRFTVGAKIEQLLKADQIPKAQPKPVAVPVGAGAAAAPYQPVPYSPAQMSPSEIARISKAILD